MKPEIQMQFGTPGDWGDYLMTAVWVDASGFRHSDAYGPCDIPREQQAALQTVVDLLTGLAAPWQAILVRVHSYSESVCPAAEGGDIPPVAVTLEWLELEVEARSMKQGGYRRFSVCDYPALLIREPAALAFFKHFTHQDNHDEQR